tara:strand:- start:1268 stop:1942 length:675 start_codon:yes stop_codon:yes gene_type:complete
MNKPSLGVITYNVAHLKTEQVLKKIIEQDSFSEITVFLIDFKPRKAREVYFHHRPDQFKLNPQLTISKIHNLNSYNWDMEGELPIDCDYNIITGAGLIPEKAIGSKKIINCHPGIIPLSKGLDSFKWSIIEKLELGVTLHYIDAKVDEGEIISIERTPVYATDTLDDLARRHYEIEINMLSNFMRYFGKPFECYEDGVPKMRMPFEKEKFLKKEFAEYKEMFGK